MCLLFRSFNRLILQAFYLEEIYQYPVKKCYTVGEALSVFSWLLYISRNNDPLGRYTAYVRVGRNVVMGVCGNISSHGYKEGRGELGLWEHADIDRNWGMEEALVCVSSQKVSTIHLFYFRLQTQKESLSGNFFNIDYTIHRWGQIYGIMLQI